MKPTQPTPTQTLQQPSESPFYAALVIGLPMLSATAVALAILALMWR